MTAKNTALIPVDGHVHLHSSARAPAALDAAAAHFRQARSAPSGCLGALLLTQAAGERVFEDLMGRSACGSWEIRHVPDEPQSLIATRQNEWIAIVCGRQVRCERGLEVVGLGTLQEFVDGNRLHETIRHVQASGALACLPWGFGKWSGARGRLVRTALDANDVNSLTVCDNGGRLEVLGRPGLLREAERRGFKVLPGTDPFPLGEDYRRTGGFGFFAAAPGRERPWHDMMGWILAQEQSPGPYGRALGPFRFLYNNIGIQWHNRRKRKEA